ncbi:hypothetical protein BDB01DRAFT_252021 [Pilobolus umbonatus]|nr:hypothetical protein BDB01DRAFT_252021 [Pilobolus umbonatus]
MNRSRFPCRWSTCVSDFDNVEDLFNHLSDEHVGRKATNNLCLQCHWNNCGVITAKRDHLASHLRVHLPLKPHQCNLCSKGFKRPQDLKKHEKIHTIEHQASLLSNQPGYKPVRRRRKVGHQPSGRSTKISPSPSIASHKDSVSDASPSSPSFSIGETLSSSDKTDNSVEGNQFYANHYQQDTLQGFMNDILHDSSLLPHYDADMMRRLNTIAPAIQYQAPGWILPCQPEAIPALQNWLEQLSADIDTDDNIYPDIIGNHNLITPPLLSSDQSHFMFDTSDYDLYPKLGGMNTWAAPSTLTTPIANSVFMSESDASSPTSINNKGANSQNDINIQAQFWSPGYSSSPVKYDMEMDEPSLSNPIEFKMNSRTQYEVEPNYYFETSQQETEMATPVINSTESFENKQYVVSMMNVFSAPNSCRKDSGNSLKSDIIIEEEEEETDLTAEEEDTVPENEEEEEGEREVISKRTSMTSTSSCSTCRLECPSISTKDCVESPYADLVGLIANMKVESEDTIRKRHIAIINTLWKAIRST